MTDTSVMRVKQEAFQQSIEDKTVEGWELASSNDRVAILKKKGGYGGVLAHVLIFIFLGWWTLLIGNVIYAGVSYMRNGKELQIKVIDPPMA